MSRSFLRHEILPAGNVLALTLPHPMDDERLDILNIQLAAAMDGRRDELWVIDMSGVSYLGSSMLGFLVNLRHQIKAGGGRMVLCCLSPMVLDLFRNSSMERLFTIEKDRAAAMA